MAQNPGLGVFGRYNIAVNGNPPALIHAHLRVAGHAVHHGCQFRTKKENVYASVGGHVIKLCSDGFFQGTGIEITDQSAININGGASLSYVSTLPRNGGLKSWGEQRRTRAIGLSFRMVSLLL